MREIHSHTAIRGIAALLVVVFHYRINLRPDIDVDGFTAFFAKGYLWVDCFFILSGFVLCHVYGIEPGRQLKITRNFFSARLARIYPLYIVTLIALVCWQKLLSELGRDIQIGSLGTLWLNVFVVQAWIMPSFYDWNFPGWSISVECLAYLLFPIAAYGLAQHRKLTVILLGLTLIAPLALGHDRWEQTAIIRGVPLFFAGVLLYQFRNSFQLPAVAFLQGTALISLILAMHFGAPDQIVDALFAALIGLTWSDAGLGRFANSIVLTVLGNWSYSIYMLHAPVRIVLFAVIAGRVSPIVFFVSCLAATIALGALSYRWLEMPARRALKQLLERRFEPLSIISD